MLNISFNSIVLTPSVDVVVFNSSIGIVLQLTGLLNVIFAEPSKLIESLSPPYTLILSTFKILAIILYSSYLVTLMFDHCLLKEDQQPLRSYLNQ